MSIETIVTAIKLNDYISDAIIYGSYLYGEDFVDCDIAVFIKGGSIIDSDAIKSMYEIKKNIEFLTGVDVDIIPHTHDELTDSMTPLYFPRYNPSLCFGNAIKGDLKIEKPKNKTVTLLDLSKYIIYDTRTIIRRQMCRDSTRSEIDIFLSKVSHLPGNILTLISYFNNDENYKIPPSNIYGCAKLIDKEFKDINSVEMIRVISDYRNHIRHNDKKKYSCEKECLEILYWYEKSASIVINHINKMILNQSASCVDLA